MQYSYGAPSSAISERPKCWSKSFDEGARECKGCSFQTSCKEEIVRLNSMRAAPPAPYYQPATPQYYQPYAVPTPVQYAQPAPQPQQIQQQPPMYQVPQPQQVPLYRPPQPVQPPPQQLQRSIYPPPTDPYGYGWIQDPLYHSLTSAPPPMRPQMGNESFFQRVAKNTGLAMMESFFGQCLLAVRQLVLAPPPQPRVVEVQQEYQQQEVHKQ